MKIWAKTKEFSEGKFLVVRRDGTVPHWPHFVLGARDPASPTALRAYADACGGMPGFDADYIASIRELADDFDAYRAAEVPPDARDDLLSMFDGLCAYCNEPATVIDHVVPVVVGGMTEPGNVLPACSTCNGSKHSRDIYEWLDATGRVPRVETLEWLAHHQILEAA